MAENREEDSHPTGASRPSGRGDDAQRAVNASRSRTGPRSGHGSGSSRSRRRWTTPTTAPRRPGCRCPRATASVASTWPTPAAWLLVVTIGTPNSLTGGRRRNGRAQVLDRVDRADSASSMPSKSVGCSTMRAGRVASGLQLGQAPCAQGGQHRGRERLRLYPAGAVDVGPAPWPPRPGRGRSGSLVVDELLQRPGCRAARSAGSPSVRCATTTSDFLHAHHAVDPMSAWSHPWPPRRRCRACAPSAAGRRTPVEACCFVGNTSSRLCAA